MNRKSKFTQSVTALYCWLSTEDRCENESIALPLCRGIVVRFTICSMALSTALPAESQWRKVRYEKVGQTDIDRSTKKKREPIDKAYYICQTYNLAWEKSLHQS